MVERGQGVNNNSRVDEQLVSATDLRCLLWTLLHLDIQLADLGPIPTFILENNQSF